MALFFYRNGSGGAVGPCLPAGQLQPGELHLPGHAAQHRQDHLCLQRGIESFFLKYIFIILIGVARWGSGSQEGPG